MHHTAMSAEPLCSGRLDEALTLEALHADAHTRRASRLADGDGLEVRQEPALRLRGSSSPCPRVDVPDILAAHAALAAELTNLSH
jgi:hypothetical protein